MKKNQEDFKLEFLEVIGAQNQIELLYKLLDERKYSISHSIMPSFKEHEEFVKHNPYRAWFFIQKQDKIIGSFYIQHDNTIGLNLIEVNENIMKKIIKFIINNFSPNPPSKSQIAAYFSINVPYKFRELRNSIEAISCTPIQISYRIDL